MLICIPRTIPQTATGVTEAWPIARTSVCYISATPRNDAGDDVLSMTFIWIMENLYSTCNAPPRETQRESKRAKPSSESPKHRALYYAANTTPPPPPKKTPVTILGEAVLRALGAKSLRAAASWIPKAIPSAPTGVG